MNKHNITKVERSSGFKRTYKKKSTFVQEKFKKRFSQWVYDPFGHNYKTEPLKSDNSIWKFNIDNDYRVLFQWKRKFTEIQLIGIYNHNELLRKGYY
ncbi:MAG: hypothetical protein VR72_11700 [Clostridiaceae bacterium BRH_c20a]|nr:MAG: hypothetical protein VR72_11700 [Clostridiaceae bacterium BRH_c20a]